MGKLNYDPQIHHFSHPHPLELFSPQNQSPLSQISAPPPPCSGCKLQLPSSAGSDGFIYTCKPCKFSLHVSCTQFPQLITHPSHPSHPLTLLPAPTYPGGKFNCDACNRRGDGFSYHCSQCDFDLHVICASKPLSATNPFHQHLLNLTFSSPYNEMKGFSCDVCRKIGTNQWLYRCVPCEFDVHLECVSIKPVAPPPPPVLQHHYSMPAVHPNQLAFQGPMPVAAQGGDPYGNHPLMHSASTGGRLQNNYAATSTNNYPTVNNYPATPAGMGRSSSTGVGGRFQHNYTYAAGGGVQSNYPVPAVAPNYNTAGGGGQGNNLGNAVMTGLVEGAAQQVGQTLMQSILGGGNDGSSGGGDGGGGFLDSLLGN